MNKKNPIVIGTIILTLAGFATKIIGFFFRIFLSRSIGAEGMGIYQLVFPLFTLCHSLCCSGIEISISRYVATKNGRRGNTSEKLLILISGIALAVSFSLVTSLFLYLNAYPISKYILQDIRCHELLKCLAIALPLSSIHACINGYYFGLKKALIPGISQFIEQIVRTITVYFSIIFLTNLGITITPVVAIYGTIAGELSSAFFTTCSLIKSKKETKLFSNNEKLFSYMKNIMNMSFPITLNRVMTTALMNIEVILIPFCLKLGGHTSSEALSIYGVLTGMAMPLVLFPSSIITSISTLLLPTISEAQTDEKSDSISHSANTVIHFCLVTGIFCTFAFIYYGNTAGYLLFNSTEPGPYIVTLAWLCPFLYISITLSSILNGLGKTTITFYHSIIVTIIKILFIIIFVPTIGIKGYLWGILFGYILLCLLHYRSLASKYKLNLEPFKYILLPILFSVLSIIIAVPFYKFAGTIFGYVSYTTLAIEGLTTSLFYLLLVKLFIKF